RGGLGLDRKDLLGKGEKPSRDALRENLIRPHAERIFWLRYALRSGMTPAEVHELSSVDPWFLAQIAELSETEDELRAAGSLDKVPDALFRRAKRQGFSDAQFAFLFGRDVLDVRADRKRRGILPTYKLVDTCAAEFEAATPYYYSTWEDECEARVSAR